MITIQDGNYHYTEETGVHDIQLQIQKGETVGLMGPNGAGKSTLFKILVGSCPSRLVSTTSRIGPLTKTS